MGEEVDLVVRAVVEEIWRTADFCLESALGRGAVLDRVVVRPAGARASWAWGAPLVGEVHPAGLASR